MKKILVIEDNKDVRENIVEILELSDYEVRQAPDGKAGVEIALKENPDLIICDIMMPVLDGYGVLHLLSKHKETFGNAELSALRNLRDLPFLSICRLSFPPPKVPRLGRGKVH